MITYPLVVGELMTRVIEAGEGDKAIVFIHGLGARADRWKLNLDAFAAQGYHCYAIDLPGHGFATKGESAPADVPALAHFVGDVLRVLQLPRPILIGTSLGGHIAATLACVHPDAVEKLVLVGAVGIIPIGREAGEAIRKSVRETSREAVDRKLRGVFNKTDVITPDLVAEEVRINNSGGAAISFERLGDYIAARIDTDNIGQKLKALVGRTPMLLVWGEQDRIIPLAIALQAQALLGAVDLTIIPGAGHAPYMEDPASFNADVIAFLAQD
jgi:pimeloyl-ACP methyl ester carboxylesterase